MHTTTAASAKKDIIRASSNLYAIYSRPEFKSIRDVIYPPFLKRLGLFSLGFITNFSKPWTISDIENGLNFLSYNFKNGAKRIDLNDAKSMMIYLPAKKENAPCAIICPGGAYGLTASICEGYPVAQKLIEAGYAVFILNYRVKKDAHYPAPFDDLAAAVRYIQDNADELKIQREYCIFGFSAGGHMAAIFGTKLKGYAHYGLKKPFAVMLGYPVITMHEITHLVSRKNLLQDEWENEDKRNEFSAELIADNDFPPAFIWSFDNDPSVNPENTRVFSKKLAELEVKHTVRIYKGAIHGCGIGTGTDAEGWIDEAIAFLNENR
ncbi:MAG: alpha/beta hydrolase [Christensenellaceae bacterium]|nr:alpha/beta hydrolase [Christensenellaceae bacterium]